MVFLRESQQSIKCCKWLQKKMSITPEQIYIKKNIDQESHIFIMYLWGL
jgi:hypothetical protein